MQRTTKLRVAKGVVILAAVPFLIYAYEYGPDAGAAGVPNENGTCSQIGCHTGTAVNAPGGSVSVTFPNGLTYSPGATQHLVVTIDDSKQRRWGFELTARPSSDLTQMAGSFLPTDKRTQLICSSVNLVRQQNFSTACPATLPLSYIEHTQAGYDFVQPNPGTYEFDWTAPATGVGPVAIYVAANAANGDLTQNGDHIYTANYTLTVSAGPPPPPIPSIAGVSNAASQAIAGLPNSAVAQGAIFVINGNNLGPDPAAQAAVPLQTSLAGTSVQVTVNGTSVAAPIAAASATQITAIMPSAMPAGSGTTTVIVNGQASAPAPVQVATAAFGIYTLNNAGSGPARIADSDGNAVTLTRPAQPGSTVILTGTGLGASSGDDVSQPAKQDFSASVTLYVGTEQVSVQYAGRSGSAPGQDQIAFTIPADAITGCYVPVAVMVNKITSNFASLAIAPDGSTCSDGNGFTAAQMQQIQSAAGGNTRLATLNLARTVSSSAGTIDNGAAAFGMYTPAQLASALGPSRAPSVGGCTVFPFSGASPGITDPTQPQGLNAGAAITVSGPKGDRQLTVAQGGNAGVYGAQATSANGGTLFLDPGSYTFSGAGGADVGSLQGQFTVPAPIVWSNAAGTTSVTRAQGVTVTWTGGDPNGFVNISGYALATQAGTGAMFTCTAAASAGTFTAPPMVTQALPASTSGGLTLMGVSAPTPFTAQGIDIGLATASSGVSQPAVFQ